jgi:hypothetical protein
MLYGFNSEGYEAYRFWRMFCITLVIKDQSRIFWKGISNAKG